MPATGSYDVIVAGAGIIGASIAWHTAHCGLRTAIIDAAGPAAGATGASDGAVSVASKKPGVMADLAGKSLCYADILSQEGQVLNRVFHKRPSFLFASNPIEIEALDRLTAMLAKQESPVSIKRDGLPDQSAIFGLGEHVTRVLELAGEGHMLGYEANLAFLNKSGADFSWPCKVLSFESAQNQVTLYTDKGEFHARKLVLAAGIGAASLLPALPLFPRSGQLIITDHATEQGPLGLPGPLTSASYLLDKSTHNKPLQQAPVVIDPLATGQLLIGSSRENHGSENRTDFHTIKHILTSAVHCLPAIARRRIIRVFAGVRTACKDGLPIIGEMPNLPNVTVALGFEGDGICLSPLVGREVAKLLTGNKPISEIGALSPNRFDIKKATAS